MPIYEYHCQSCNRHFELLVGVSDNKARLNCPHCQSKKVKKLFSSFGFTSEGKSSTSTSPSCSTCTASTCKPCLG